MNITAEKEFAHLGESHGAANHDHDMIHELRKRLDSLWRVDQYIANAEGHDELRRFWSELKKQEQANVDRLKGLVCKHCAEDCF